MPPVHRLLVSLAVAGLALTPLTPAAGTPARQARSPAHPLNLIVIVTDDQAQWSIGAYGNRESRTPHMDRLAREGVRFLNAFTPTPVCSPSRASFLTGLYGTEVGITDYLAPVEEERGLGLPPRTVTWPEVLQQRGYRTALFGKWHLGRQPRFHPTRHGYHRFVGFLGGSTSPMDPTLEVDGELRKLPGPEPDVVTDAGLDFIRSHAAGPFAISIHYRAPHLPYGPVPDHDSAPFSTLDPAIPAFKGLDAAQVKRWTRDYYASIHSVDRNIGRLLAVLDERGLADRTVVVLTSDHGYMIGHHGLHTKGNARWVAGGTTGPTQPNLFEESLRVPLIVRGPVVARPGSAIAEMVSGIDTFASVLGLLKVRTPPGVRQHGADFSPLVRGEAAQGWRDAVFVQYDLHNFGLARMRAVRELRWKLVRYYGSNGLDQLFDLDTDPGETANLYTRPEAAATRDRLQQRLDAWMKGIADPLRPR